MSFGFGNIEHAITEGVSSFAREGSNLFKEFAHMPAEAMSGIFHSGLGSAAQELQQLGFPMMSLVGEGIDDFGKIVSEAGQLGNEGLSLATGIVDLVKAAQEGGGGGGGSGHQGDGASQPGDAGDGEQRA